MFHVFAQAIGKNLPDNLDNRLFSLPFDDRIKSFVDLTVLALSAGLSCIHYHQIKREELFMYLRAGYTKEELAMFFLLSLERILILRILFLHIINKYSMSGSLPKKPI